MEYCLITICTKPYRDILEFALPSWINNSSASRIYICTDDNIPCSDLVVTEKISYSSDKNSYWLDIVNSKPNIILNIIKKYPHHEAYVFIDCDCYMVHDIKDAFRIPFVIAAADQTNRNPNSGLVMMKNHDMILEIIEEWDKRTQLYKKENVGMKHRESAADEFALKDIMMHNCSCYLDGDYNCIVNYRFPIYSPILRAKVLHFINRSSRNTKFVNKVMDSIQQQKVVCDEDDFYTNIKISGEKRKIYHHSVNSDLIAQYLRKNKILWSNNIFDKFKHLLNDKMTVIDCGAHIGCFTLLFDGVVKKIHAIEPNFMSFDLLEKNISKKTKSKIITYNLCVGEKKQLYNCVHQDKNNSGHCIFCPSLNGLVTGTTLDDLFYEPIDFIKIDTEGNELNILKGATRILKNHHPVLCVEMHGKDDSIFDFLQPFNYQINTDLFIS